MKAILNQLFEHRELSRDQARDVLHRIAASDFNNSQVAAFMTVYLMRSVSVEELSGFRDALLDLCLPFDLEGQESVDLCGTGGDGKDTFNISTLSSFVVAGANYKVSKHGNYGVSSICGSSNVLESLGYKFTNDVDRLKKQLDEANICFLHAPLFHPAMKSVGPVRRELGVKTFFNMLGPLVNPAKPVYQLSGVFDLKLARIYPYLLRDCRKQFKVLHSLDGYDEISLTSAFKVIDQSGERLMEPEDLNLQRRAQEEIKGGKTIEESAAIFQTVLDGRGSAAQNEVVMANAATAISCFDDEMSFEDAIGKARVSLESGAAKKCLEKILSLT